MQRIVRRSIVIALLAGVAIQHATAQAAVAPDTLKPGTAVIVGRGKSRAFSVLETAAFLALLNVYDRVAYADETVNGTKVFSTTLATAWDHLRSQHWVQDKDPFNVNQFGHPYQGATVYGLARSSGHGFWTSLVHADIGSFLWEMAGETSPPSVNDLITTGHAGSLLGEALYRLSDLVLKVDDGGKRSRWREYSAALISPPSGVNRRILGSRYEVMLPDSTPATSWQVRIGATMDALASDITAPKTLLRRDATADFAIAYGLPGRPGYRYTRPMDYFDFQFSVLLNAKNPIEHVMIRGLLLGTETAEREHSSGIWGLYGTYDYISPYLFRVSSTALSLGTTRQYLIGPWLELQGSVLGGVGYGAAGSPNVIPATLVDPEVRDYHAGVTPQALLALRLVAGDRAMFDVATRGYYVMGPGSDDTRGTETIFRGDFGLTVRLRGGHAIGARYVASTRDARYGKQPDRTLSEGTVTLSYSILGGNRFTAVKPH